MPASIEIGELAARNDVPVKTIPYSKALGLLQAWGLTVLYIQDIQALASTPST